MESRKESMTRSSTSHTQPRSGWMDVALRFWRYADFKLDYTLAQQFNYEYTILQTAWDKECKHIVRLRDVFLNKDCAVFE